VTVEDAADFVGDGLVHVAPFDEHRVDGGDRARVPLPRALEETREHREDARWIATPRGGLAGRETNLALGPRESRDGVDEQEHARPFVAKRLGIRGRDLRRTQPLQSRRVAGGRNHDAPCAPFLAERMIDELLHLASALTHQRDDDDVRRCAACDGAEERALADARAGKESDALPFAEREEAVEDTHARGERRFDGPTAQRVRRIAVDRNDGAPFDRPPFERMPEAIHDAPQERTRRAHLERPTGALDVVIGPNAGHVPERHGDRVIVSEADDLTREWLTAAIDVNDVADTHARDGETKREARHAEDAAGWLDGGDAREARADGVGVHERRVRRGGRGSGELGPADVVTKQTSIIMNVMAADHDVLGDLELLPPPETRFTLGDEITPIQRRFLDHYGFIVFSKVATPAEVAMIVGELDRIEGEWVAAQRKSVYGIPLFWGKNDGKPFLQRFPFTSVFSPPVREFVRDPRFAPIRALVGKDARVGDDEKDGVVVNRYLNTAGSAFPRLGWHTDGLRDLFYLRMPKPMLNIGLHLDHCTADNGGLRLLPGSHTQGFFSMCFRKPYFVSHAPDPNEVVVETEAGDLTVHDGRLWHRVAASTRTGPASLRRSMYVPYLTDAYQPKSDASKTPLYHRLGAKLRAAKAKAAERRERPPA
jgi:phytanoyl-CoA hydroxylase